MNDCNKLQVLQNSVKRLITGARHRDATADLLSDTNSLSIQQEPERRDVNLQIQRRSKKVGDRSDTSETRKVTTKERKTRGKAWPLQ
jgi:hypothetical protein